MNDFHAHTILSDGELIPSELVRRFAQKGYTAIALTDHIDRSNIDFVIPRIKKVCAELNKYWKIKVIPGAELTHVPIQAIPSLVKLARRLGARIIVGHGETISEPVIKGTNRAFIKAGIDILAHPGMITLEDAVYASKMNVYLEVTTRKSHAKTNKHVIKTALKGGARLILNSDTHSDQDIMDIKKKKDFLLNLTNKKTFADTILKNSDILLKKVYKKS